MPYSGFDSESSYMVSGFNFETKTGVKVSVFLAGKANDRSIQKMKLIVKGKERELQIFKSGLFFAIVEEPFSSIEKIPIRATKGN
ncbi:hypothetical protein [Alkalihalobacillus sp. AL-G]|uniref:hypothetical protein n=1 Tax=Alkalihalobacillus sp. AL-G TaxID=2926399 RepID=UPI00272C3BAF|nr:hypothetical protein [Alkalihalobacillus sp. AL-G]WLD94387.1 hypothetical protein MOJ78_05735 [Alkalihalobacillus sp. AL-G]